MKTKKILITSGGTRVPIDRVRHVANMSQGTFGSDIASCFLHRGCEENVVFLRAEKSKSPMSVTIDLNRSSVSSAFYDLADLVNLYEGCNRNYEERVYKTFADYADMLKQACQEKPDIVVLAAAVSDYGTKPLKGKVRSRSADMSIKLHKLPKLIGHVKEWCPKTFLVGFKLLVDSTREELFQAALDSCENNSCDMVVANDLRDIQNDDHRVMLVYPDRRTKLMSKNELMSSEGLSLADFVVRNIMDEYLKTNS
jgi:phosphopantothenate-cysteine ligase